MLFRSASAAPPVSAAPEASASASAPASAAVSFAPGAGYGSISPLKPAVDLSAVGGQGEGALNLIIWGGYANGPVGTGARRAVKPD